MAVSAFFTARQVAVSIERSVLGDGSGGAVSLECGDERSDDYYSAEFFG